MQHVGRRSLQTCGIGRGCFLTGKPVTIGKTVVGSWRCKVSSVLEPPLDCHVLEKPCTLVLVQDSWLYHASWEHKVHFNIPSDFGMSYIPLTFTSSTSIEDVIDEMKKDLSPIHDAILVTRGPIATWVALFYLESFSLKGLVMIDPIPFDRFAHPSEQVLLDLQRISTSNNNLVEDFSCQEAIIHQACSKKLKLEPNSVPMMVIQSIHDENLARLANQMAERHGDPNGPFGVVEVVQIPQDEPNLTMERIDAWIESIL